MKGENMKRHGDVQFVRVDAIPEGAVSLGARREVAYGEVTGHAHRIDLGELFQTKDGNLYLKVDKLTRVSHEEHKTSVLEPGFYFCGQKRQYDAENGWSTVRD